MKAKNWVKLWGKILVLGFLGQKGPKMGCECGFLTCLMRLCFLGEIFSWVFWAEAILICKNLINYALYCFKFVDFLLRYPLQLQKLIMEVRFLERLVLQSISYFTSIRVFNSSWRSLYLALSKVGGHILLVS